jgi:hypothetical protein
VTEDTRARLALVTSRTLTEDEAREWLDSPIGDAEREQVLELVRWFTRRYPTPAARLAYVRQAYRRWHHSSQRT